MDINVAPGGVEVIPVSTPAEPDRTPIDVREAARQLSNYRFKRDNPEPEAPQEQPAASPPEVENSAPAEAGDPPQEAPAAVETEQPAEPEEPLPPIDPPRSWTRDEKDRFNSLPRETQEYIAQREQERERELRRSQNEAAEQRKAIDAERSKVEDARKQYEEALPALLQTLHQQQQGEFADIKTMADVERLAREDWPRYALWDAQQKKIAAVTQEVQAAQKRQAEETSQKWNDYASKQDALLIEKVPELADKKRQSEVADKAVKLLRDVGFEDRELAEAWNSPMLRDHRMQLILLDATKYRDAKANIAKPAAKPLPPVQKPGVSKAPTSAADAEIQELEKQFHKTGSAKDAARLLTAKRAKAG